MWAHAHPTPSHGPRTDVRPKPLAQNLRDANKTVINCVNFRNARLKTYEELCQPMVCLKTRQMCFCSF